MTRFIRMASIALVLAGAAVGLGSLAGCGSGSMAPMKDDKMKGDKMMKDDKMKDDKMTDDKMKDDKMKDDKMKK